MKAAVSGTNRGAAAERRSASEEAPEGFPHRGAPGCAAASFSPRARERATTGLHRFELFLSLLKRFGTAYDMEAARAAVERAEARLEAAKQAQKR